VDHDVMSQDIAIIHFQYNLPGLHYVHEKQASTGNALRHVTPSLFFSLKILMHVRHTGKHKK